VVTIQLGGHSWILFPEGGLFWPKHSALLVADLHLGKDATFRSFGIGVPSGSTTATLKRVSKLLNETGAKELFVLGDLCHARSSLTATTNEAFIAFQDQHRSVQLNLIEGNHDRSTGRLPDEWRIEVVGPTLHLDGVVLVHEPTDCPRESRLVIGGHLHPAYQLFHGGEKTGKLPCFWYSKANRQLIVPACGKWTGTARVKPHPSDQIWVIAENQVIAVGPNA
jgi:DNA ligase-associated metallophosphoesterase